MQTVIVQINNNSAMDTLKELADKQFINIIDNSDTDALILPGEALSLAAFKKWINEAEAVPTISLRKAKSQWANKSRPSKIRTTKIK